jgi:hypothetical protein
MTQRSYEFEIEANFKYRPVSRDQVNDMEAVMAGCKQLAELLNIVCPSSREKSLAITKLEEAMFWANASIARNQT